MADNEDNTVIWIITDTLSDGSEVFAVEIEGHKFDCVTEKDAREFADEFQSLLEKHTNYEAVVIDA